MIKIAKTEEEYKRCWNYLNDKNSCPLKTATLYYVEVNGEIKACAGWSIDTGSQIEPMQAEDNISAYKLFYFMQGLIIGKGYSMVRIILTNDKVISNIKKEGYELWSGFIKEYKKEFV
jgi:hypothetical protein